MKQSAAKLSRKPASLARTGRRPAPRKPASQRPATAKPRRKPTSGKVASPGAAQAARPRLSRITADLTVVPPMDCEASIIMKLIAQTDRRYYACWLLVGRYDHDAMSVPYDFNGESAVRCDIPTGAVLSLAALQPHLTAFLKAEGKEPPDTTVIVGKGRGANP